MKIHKNTSVDDESVDGVGVGAGGVGVQLPHGPGPGAGARWPGAAWPVQDGRDGPP